MTSVLNMICDVGNTRRAADKFDKAEDRERKTSSGEPNLCFGGSLKTGAEGRGTGREILKYK